MRRTQSSFTILALALSLVAAAVPAWGAAVTASRAVERWDVFELELRGPSDGNPFADVRLSAVFTDGARTVEVPGFYDGDGVYRVRFMPETTGAWRYETKSNRWPLTGQTGAFTVTPAATGNHGPVRVRGTFHFAYADGTPFKQIGTTIYNWIDAPDEVQEQTVRTLAGAPFNKARMLLTQQPESYRRQFAPPRWPYAGKPPRDWDFARFNPDYFRHYEKRIAQLRELGVEADLIFFNPYGKPWGFSELSPAQDELFIRYVVARFAAFRNIWWSLANEYDLVRVKTEADWDRLGRIVQEADPFNHLRSIHNSGLVFDHGKPWVTHVSLQNGAAVEEAGRAQLYRDVWRKPVVYDEVKYEGNSRRRWGQLSGPEMVHRFWCGTVAGTYVGHGDFFEAEDAATWTSFGGVLRGESASRLGFLRGILESGPAEGLDPIDKWQDATVAGRPGEYYLVYLGREPATRWPFQLFRNGVEAGMRFKVEVIDTWAMTVTPVEGEFVTAKQDDYHYVDAVGRSVELPGKPGIALRIQRVGGDGVAARPKPDLD